MKGSVSSNMELAGTWDRYSETNFSSIQDFSLRLEGIGGGRGFMDVPGGRGNTVHVIASRGSIQFLHRR